MSRSLKWSLAGIAISFSLRRCDLGYDHGPNIQVLRFPDQWSRTLVIRWSRSFRDFAYREFLCHIPLTPPMCRSAKFQSLTTCPLAPMARIVSQFHISWSWRLAYLYYLDSRICETPHLLPRFLQIERSPCFQDFVSLLHLALKYCARSSGSKNGRSSCLDLMHEICSPLLHALLLSKFISDSIAIDH
jgi:hypothetical protein